MGGWRPICLTAPPFSFPHPIESIVEGIPDWGQDLGVTKLLSLWRVNDLPMVQPGTDEDSRQRQMGRDDVPSLRSSKTRTG